jgi:hypothetical protein
MRNTLAAFLHVLAVCTAYTLRKVQEPGALTYETHRKTLQEATFLWRHFLHLKSGFLARLALFLAGQKAPPHPGPPSPDVAKETGSHAWMAASRVRLKVL